LTWEKCKETVKKSKNRAPNKKRTTVYYVYGEKNYVHFQKG